MVIVPLMRLFAVFAGGHVSRYVAFTVSGSVVVATFFLATVVGVDFFCVVLAETVVVVTGTVVSATSVVDGKTVSMLEDELPPTLIPAIKTPGITMTIRAAKAHRFEMRSVMWSLAIQRH
jgi:hypothetical protein